MIIIMSKKYIFNDEELLLKYEPEIRDVEHFLDSFNRNETVRLGALNLSQKNIVECDEYTITFIIGIRDGEYYKLDKEIFGNEYEFMLHQELPNRHNFKLENKHFFQGPFARVIPMISEYANSDIKIVPNDFPIINDGFIPVHIFEKLIEKFPNQREIALYKRACISSVIGEYFSDTSAIQKYNDYVETRRKDIKDSTQIIDINRDIDIYKYNLILFELKNMLNGNYSELEWQEKLLPIILLMYPRYVKCLKKVRLSLGNGKYKEIDYMLIDSDGNVDIIELKKPFEECVLRKAKYRENYIPGLELSGAIQQVQKYVYYLSTFKHLNEEKLNEKYGKELSGVKIKIVNPQGIIICGRKINFTEQQDLDYEIIKRQYKALTEILTYDELIKRLENTLNILESK